MPIVLGTKKKNSLAVGLNGRRVENAIAHPALLRGQYRLIGNSLGHYRNGLTRCRRAKSKKQQKSHGTELILWHAECMPISARNQLVGKISEVQLGDIMAHVAVRIGKNIVESVITRKSADELALKKGDTVTVVIKSTEVMLQKG